MRYMTSDQWAAVWADPKAWTALWAQVKEDVDCLYWANEVLPFLKDCALVRSSKQERGRVLMHRRLAMLVRDGHPGGDSTFVLIHPETGVSLVSTTREPVRDEIAYCAAVEKKTGYLVREIEPGTRDHLFSVSSIANKPATAQAAFTQGRAASGLI